MQVHQQCSPCVLVRGGAEPGVFQTAFCASEQAADAACADEVGRQSSQLECARFLMNLAQLPTHRTARAEPVPRQIKHPVQHTHQRGPHRLLAVVGQDERGLAGDQVSWEALGALLRGGGSQQRGRAALANRLAAARDTVRCGGGAGAGGTTRLVRSAGLLEQG